VTSCLPGDKTRRSKGQGQGANFPPTLDQPPSTRDKRPAHKPAGRWLAKQGPVYSPGPDAAFFFRRQGLPADIQTGGGSICQLVDEGGRGTGVGPSGWVLPPGRSNGRGFCHLPAGDGFPSAGGNDGPRKRGGLPRPEQRRAPNCSGRSKSGNEPLFPSIPSLPTRKGAGAQLAGQGPLVLGPGAAGH